jgi:hypothetical protein
MSNIIKHFNLITKHKWNVFKLCLKAGIPFRGLIHDLSKYSPTEFIESIKFYVGTHSPITEAKKTNGYSKAWLHHKGRNKHHYEYWYDATAPEKTPIIPYKYAVEMVCDTLAAGKTYLGKSWTNSSQLDYWNRTKDLRYINQKTAKFLEAVYIQVSKYGIDKTITKKNLKNLYNSFCN